MPGIGDYIHYNKANYIKYGINVNEKKSIDATNAFNIQRRKLKKMIPKTGKRNQDLTNLENFLNGLMYGSDGDSNEDDTKAMEKLKEMVNSVFQQNYSQLGVNFERGLQVYPDNLVTEKQLDKATIKKYLDIITNMTNGSIKLKSSAKNNIDIINNTIEELQRYVNSYEEDLLLDEKNSKRLIAQINTILKMQSLPTFKAIGDVFEYWLAIASKFVGGVAVETADKIVDDLVKGGNTSTPIISMNNFSDDYVDRDYLRNSGVFDKKWKINKYSDFEFDSPTQDKLDVIFNWHNEGLRISAKNYKLADGQPWIHLVSGTSLLFLISTEDANFVNHWLNCISSGINNNEIQNDLLQKAHTEMKLAIFMKALTGVNTSAKSNTSNVFILNNRTKKHIYVRTVSQIVGAVEQLLMMENLDILKLSNYPFIVQNKWFGQENDFNMNDAQMRISNLLATLHTHKISVSMNSNLVFPDK